MIAEVGSDAVLAPGAVALVGGGPGAVDLITVRGLALLRQADVVIVDRLAPAGLLPLLGDDVEVVPVGKEPGKHSMRQRDIEALILAHARAGKRVVRLKGGDPYLLGRGGEEVLACRAAGIDVQVVPGVTSAIAGPGAAGVPVTHRGAAVATHIVNAHGDLGPADIAALRDPQTTTVLMMGVEWLPRLVAQALLDGVDPATPVAVVQAATLPEQRAVHATLGTIAAVAAEAGIGFPAVIVAGPTAAEGFLVPPHPAPELHGSGREATAQGVPAPAPAAPPAVGAPTLIGCAHGTSNREGRDVIRAILTRVAGLLPDVPVREAYVDVQTPSPADVVREVVPAAGEVRTRDAAPDAVVVPLLLSTGFHVSQDIGDAVAGTTAVATAPLGPDPRLADVLAQRLAEAGALPDDAVVLAVAGTRDERGREQAHAMGALLADRLGRDVTVSFVAAASPSVPDAVAQARVAGGRVAVASYLLAPGYFHGLLAGAGADVVAAPLGDHPLLADVVRDRYLAVTGD